MPESVDPRHLLLIGAGPGVGASVVRRFGRESFRSTLISRGGSLEQLASELRSDGGRTPWVRSGRCESFDGPVEWVGGAIACRDAGIPRSRLSGS